MTVEYTKARTDVIVARYVEAVEAGADYDARTALVAELADELSAEAKVDVTEGSVRSKLVAEKVYVGKVKAKAVDATSKEAYVKALRDVTGLALASFDKPTKTDLKALFEWIATASDQFNAENGIVEPQAETVVEA